MEKVEGEALATEQGPAGFALTQSSLAGLSNLATMSEKGVHSAASNAPVLRSRSHSPDFPAWNVELVRLSGAPIRIKVHADGSMGQIMSRVKKEVKEEGPRIERMGRLVLLGAEEMGSLECCHSYTMVMLTAQVKAMLQRDQVVRFQLLLDGTRDAAKAETTTDS